VKQYEMFELTLQGEVPINNPAGAVPEAEFTLEGKTKRIKGFYAGNGRYKIRFYPDSVGTVNWKVCPLVQVGEQKITLMGTLVGSEECGTAPSDIHGIVRVKGLHFVYEDGNRYQPFGTTVYALIHQEKELVSQTFDTLAKAPFNKIRFCTFPKHYDYNNNEPDFFAFEKKDDKFDVSKPCYTYWDNLERCIQDLDKLGIQGDLILFHPYDRWGFSKFAYEECLVYLDYLVRRLSAFPNIWWSLANEYDLMASFKSSWWDNFAQFIGENDPYHHLLSNHNCLPYWDFSNPYTTHCSIQDTCVNRVASLQKSYDKPVVFDEVCYEGNIEFPWGNISAFEMVHRFWTAHILGGYCTHGETYLNDNGILWWSRGGVLHGESAERIAFLRKIMEELPSDPEALPGNWDNVIPEEIKNIPEESRKDDVWVNGLASLPIERLYRFIDQQGTIQSHCGDEVYLRYYGHQCCAKGMLELPEGGSYDIEEIDIWEMTRKTVCSSVSGKVEFKLSGKEGIAVLAKRKGWGLSFGNVV